MKLEFTPREHLFDYEWDFKTKIWKRPAIDISVIKELNERKNGYSAFRLVFYVALLVLTAGLTVYFGSMNLLYAIPFLYVYYYFYGFLTAASHELRHKTMFTKNLDGLQEVIFFIIQTLMWQSPHYERISHRLHHRYTMVRDNDPETDWPEVVTRSWIVGFLMKMLSRVLIVGAVVYLIIDIKKQIERAFGAGDKMMKQFCNEKEIKKIRRESAAILFIHLGLIALALALEWWLILLFITIAWQVGQVSASLYFYTEHLSKMYNTNDQRLCTRSVKVGWLVKQLYWGLDDHIEHHIYPAVPSCNLPKLHEIMIDDQDERVSVWTCWKEIITIALEKEQRPENEYVPEVIRANELNS